MNDQLEIQHFILTRFNLRLWNRDKEGQPVRTTEWLEHRFKLFEVYCMPSLVNQSFKNFEWIVLFDSKTPDIFKKRIEEYKIKCPQLIPVFVESDQGRFFAKIFREEVVKRLKSRRVITTYLDNDDALSVKFVEDLQSRVASLEDGTFINYTDGYQFYTDYKYMMQINYPRNHFMSVVENGNPNMVKTIYGYGSHYYVDRIKNAKFEIVSRLPMWCEVIHEKNMDNDAYFLLGAKMGKDREILHREFAIEEIVRTGMGIYFIRFLPRYLKTFLRRTRYYLWGRHW